MKKNNEFEGFYEDAESIEMMESINRACEMERQRKSKKAKLESEKAKIQAKKEVKADKLFKIGLFVSMVFIATGLLYLANKAYESNYNYCVANEHSAEVCESHLSK